MNKRGFFDIILFLIIIILVGIALYSLYLIILDLRAEHIQFIQNKTKTSINQTSFPGEFQFYPSMRFPTNGLSYNIDISCEQEKIERIKLALKRLEEETNLLAFFPSDKQKAEIFFSCNETEKEIEEDYFIAGEGGPAKIINTSLFYIIEQGKVLLFYEKSPCGNYNIELHELLHVFGFKHSDNKNSIMYKTTFCDQVLTLDIIKELKKIYSIPELPDLSFTDTSASKHGRYLDFSATVENQGLVKAENVILELYAEEEKIEEFELETMEYGAGKILSGGNIKIGRETTQIRFIILAGEELDKGNNIIALSLPS